MDVFDLMAGALHHIYFGAASVTLRFLFVRHTDIPRTGMQERVRLDTIEIGTPNVTLQLSRLVYGSAGF